MADPDCYRCWTGEFAPGSNVEGLWGIGEEIRFLTADGSGVLTKIKALRKNRLREFEVIGAIVGGEAQFATDDVLAWKGGRESYRLAEIGDGCRLTVGVDVPEAYSENMQNAWPRALAALKELAESGRQKGQGLKV